jgi:hypothetical protein
MCFSPQPQYIVFVNENFIIFCISIIREGLRKAGDELQVIYGADYWVIAGNECEAVQAVAWVKLGGAVGDSEEG